MLPDDSSTAQAAELYISSFAGRTDAYSYWTGTNWVKATDRAGNLVPLTPDVVIKAFQTKVPISAYALAADSTTHVACLDIDRPYGLTLAKNALWHVEQRGGIGYVEPSARGAHFWIVMSEARPGIWVRRMLRGLIAAAKMPPCPGSKEMPTLDEKQRWVCQGCPMAAPDPERSMPVHDDPKIELRPAQDRLSSPDSVGVCIRMPTMPHHRTGQRFLLIGPSGVTLPAKLTGMMLEVEPCPMAPLEELIDLAPAPKLPASPPLALRFPFGQPEADQSASEILQRLWGMAAPKVGRANLCPAHDDHRPSLSIAKDDQRVWCKNGACILNNNDRGRGTHELIALAPKRS